jgi:hypothetical protein
LYGPSVVRSNRQEKMMQEVFADVDVGGTRIKVGLADQLRA